jgi:hypothetical protein
MDSPSSRNWKTVEEDTAGKDETRKSLLRGRDVGSSHKGSGIDFLVQRFRPRLHFLRTEVDFSKRLCVCARACMCVLKITNMAVERI